MKTAFEFSKIALVLAAAGFLQACQKAPESESEKSVAADATTPLPATPSRALAVATPVPDPLAPPGIFFLLQKISITTDDGIVGLKPGQLVREVSPGVYEVAGRPLAVRPSQLTNNLRIARELAAQDAGAQAALRAASLDRQSAPISAGKPGANLAGNLASSTAPPARSTPAVRSTLAGSGAPAAPKLGGGTGSGDPEYGNRKNAKVDSKGRMYWRDSGGRTRYDF